MVNFEKLAALTAAISHGDHSRAEAIAYGESSVVKRDSPDRSWINSTGTSVPSPSKDDFYTFLTPDQVGNYSLGDIIKYREVGVSNASNVAHAWQMIYRSENSTGHPVGALTTIIVPENNTGSNVIVYPQPEDSSFIGCATSYDILTQGLANGMQEILNLGWVLNIPDHEGFNSSFVAGILEGKLTLDSIRAVENSKDVTGISNDRYAVCGYSGGSVATGWAAELQESYAPELNIAAYAMGGYVADPKAVMLKVNKTPFVGFVPAGILGLASEYPQMWDVALNELVYDNRTDFLQGLKQCSLADILQFGGKDIFSYFSDGQGVLDQDLIAEIITNNSLGKTTPKAPMYIFNGVKDQIVPIESVDKTVQYYCENGGNLVYNRGAGKDHLSMGTSGIPSVFKFIEGVFNDDVPKGCNFVGVSPDFAGNFTDGSYTNYTGSPNGNSTSGNSTSGSGASGNNGTSAGGTDSGSEASGSSGSGSSAKGSGHGSGAAASGSGAAAASGSGAAANGSGAAANGAKLLQPAVLAAVGAIFALI